MPITGDFAKLKKLSKSLRDMANKSGNTQRDVARATIPKIKKVFAEQFKIGAGPDGDWVRTKRGTQPLQSRKLGSDFKGRVIPGGVSFWSPVKWLMVHHRGYAFAARNVAARSNVLRFNAKGKLVTAKRFTKLKKGRATFAREHAVGARRLPARPLYPTRSMPPRWAAAINAGALEAMRRWQKQSTR